MALRIPIPWIKLKNPYEWRKTLHQLLQVVTWKILTSIGINALSQTLHLPCNDITIWLYGLMSYRRAIEQVRSSLG